MNKRKGHPSNSKRFRIFELDNFTCQYCGVSAPKAILHIDHIKPFSLGGTNNIDNLITSCQECNFGKGANNSNKIVDLPGRLKRLDNIKMKIKEKQALGILFPRKLRIFLAENNIKKQDFAIETNVSVQTISNWLHKNMQPNRLNAMIIDSYTRGIVSMQDMGY